MKVWTFEKSLGFCEKSEFLIKCNGIKTMMLSQIAGSLALECLKMGRATFAFSNVLNAEKVNAFFKKYDERTHPFDVQYWSYKVEQPHNDPEKRYVKGMVKFGMKQELSDVKQWFLSVFGNMMCARLSVSTNMLCPRLAVKKHEQKAPPNYWKRKMYYKY